MCQNINAFSSTSLLALKNKSSSWDTYKSISSKIRSDVTENTTCKKYTTKRHEGGIELYRKKSVRQYGFKKMEKNIEYNKIYLSTKELENQTSDNKIYNKTMLQLANNERNSETLLAKYIHNTKRSINIFKSTQHSRCWLNYNHCKTSKRQVSVIL